MKRENLESIKDFLDYVNRVIKNGEVTNSSIGGYIVGPCNLEIAKNLKLEPDTVLTAIARRYYEQGGDLSDVDAVNNEIAHRMREVAKRHPKSFILRFQGRMDGTFAVTPGVSEIDDKNMCMLLPIDIPNSRFTGIIVGNQYLGESNSAYNQEEFPFNLGGPIFIQGGYAGELGLVSSYSPPANYKELSSEKVLCNRDNLYSSFFTSALFQYDIYKYFLTTGLAPIYKIILDSECVPDEVKEAIVLYRYKTIEILDAFYSSTLADEDVLNILKNASELNEGESNSALNKIILGKKDEMSATRRTRHVIGYGSSALTETAKDPTKDLDFINLTDYRGKAANLVSELSTGNNWIYAGREDEKTHFSEFKQKLLIDFLYDNKRVAPADIETTRAFALAKQVIIFLTEMAKHIGLGWSDSYRYNTDRARKSHYNDVTGVLRIQRDLLTEMLITGGLEIEELQKVIDKAVTKCRALQPKSKSAANIYKKGSFYDFVDTIGGAYDTAGMGEAEHSKQIKKILQGVSKKIADFAGTVEKATPGETVAYAMRAFSDNESKMDEIYDMVDAAINECYDVVFGAAENED